MSKNWYKKSMPTIRQIKPFISEIAKTIKNIPGVREVRAWGSFINNANTPDFIIKDIDLIAVNDFYSEDLLSISENNTFHLSTSELINEGYDPLTVAFTQTFTDLKKYNIDHWAISGDDKLLHWGPIPEKESDWEEIKKEADTYASFMTGVQRIKLNKTNQQIKNRWSVLFDHHINKNLSGMPHGWYQSAHSVIEILPKTIKLL